jgi:ATP-binding cassette, subfamily C (CFTR/MRP), member 1
VGAYYASTAFHDRLLRSLFRSPMAFYERTPLGRILNRLSNDIDRIDENIPWAVSSAMIIFAEALNSLIAICIVIPSLMLVVFPLLAIFLVIVVGWNQYLLNLITFIVHQHLYNLASVQLRRLSSKSWSSTCSFVQDAHLGSDSIRVFNVQERFRDRCCRLTDFTNETSSAEIYTNR